MRNEENGFGAKRVRRIDIVAALKLGYVLPDRHKPIKIIRHTHMSQVLL